MVTVPVIDAVCVRDEVLEGVSVRTSVARGRHGTYAGALHSPGCSALPTQQSQQGDAAAGHRPQSNCVAGDERVALDVGVMVAVSLLTCVPDAPTLCVSLGVELDELKAPLAIVEVGGAEKMGDRVAAPVGVEDGEPRGCVHASVTWPWPPAWPAPGT